MKKVKHRSDARSQFTERAIKDAFLQLKERQVFTDITVADVCRTADLSRGAFYLHFDNLHDVLTALIEEILKQIPPLLTTGDMAPSQCHIFPLCQFIRKNPQYNSILLDDTLTSLIIRKIMCSERHTPYIESLFTQSDLSAQQANVLIYYLISGCFIACKAAAGMPDEQWVHVVRSLEQFISHGIRSFTEKN